MVLTVSDVSGLIAVGITVVQLLIPTVLPIILLGFFKSSPCTLPASTWSALAAELQSSFWPTILGTDSSASAGYVVSAVSWSKTFAKVLTAVAAIVTPLGLYQDIVAQAPTSAPFHYLEDKSVIGNNTPPRNAEIQFSRICGGYDPIMCPGSQGNITTHTNSSGEFTNLDRYDTKIPPHVMESFQSGLSSMEASVSSIFDIQSRYTSSSQTIDSRNPVDNGTGYSVSQLRPIQSHITDREYHLVEGLVIDLQAGGIGFRNHTAPPWRRLGSEWSEDLLFMEPETQCVDLNLTIDFHVAESPQDGGGGYTDIVLTDRGGFSGFPKDESPSYWTTVHHQDDPELWQRAFTAAWVNNFMSMLFMNVTNLRNYNESGKAAFAYLDSHRGKTFPLDRKKTGYGDLGINHHSLQVSSVGYGSYLNQADIAIGGNSSNSETGNSTDYVPALYENPFDIQRSNFTSATELCSRTTRLDYANISNIDVHCGLVYGVPQRQTPGDPIMFNDPGSNWSIPLYSCASGVKATIKTVSFKFNGSDDLSGLSLTKIKAKEYTGNSSKPLWGVENSKLPLRDARPLWGLVSSEAASRLGLSTLRKEHLWLPGSGVMSLLTTTPNSQNLPGNDFYGDALAGMFDVESGAMGFFDYSGAGSISLLIQWQKLSQTWKGTAEALNLIWTDIAANYVLGTRSAVSSSTGGNAKRAQTNVPDIKVIFYVNSLRFHMLYGIPAFLTLAMTLLVCGFALVSILVHGSGPRRMTQFLNWTSVGRIFTSLNSDHGSEESVIYLTSKRTKIWAKDEGKRGITVMNQEEANEAESNPQSDTESKPEQETEITDPSSTPEENDTPQAQLSLLRAQSAP